MKKGWKVPRPGLIADVTKEALLHDREADPEWLSVRCAPEEWQDKETLDDIREWVGMIEEAAFKKGSVIEIFLLCYALHMCLGMGDGAKLQWCPAAMKRVGKWLCDMV